jgi:sortase A
LGWELPPSSHATTAVLDKFELQPTVTSISAGSAIGRLEIPSIDLSAMLVEGTGERELRRGVGHIEGTALPGQHGNIGLAAHRDTFFRRLAEVQNGDAVNLVTLEGTDHYVVKSIDIVDPDETMVLHDIGHPALTLVTCYPFFYLGSAPKRYIVQAARLPETPRVE